MNRRKSSQTLPSIFPATDSHNSSATSAATFLEIKWSFSLEMTGSMSDLDNCLDPTRDDNEFQRPPPPPLDGFDSISVSSSSDSSSKGLISADRPMTLSSGRN